MLLRSFENVTNYQCIPTTCPRNIDPFYTVSYHIKWGKSSWAYRTLTQSLEKELNHYLIQYQDIWTYSNSINNIIVFVLNHCHNKINSTALITWPDPWDS